MGDRSGENQGDINFVIDGKNFYLKRDLVFDKSQYFSELLKSTSSTQKIRILLPNWISQQHYLLLVSYLENGYLTGIDANLSKSLLHVADFFKIGMMLEYLIKEHLNPQLTNEVVVPLIKLSHNKVKMRVAGMNTWKLLYDTCIKYASKNAHALCQTYKKQISEFETDLIEEFLKAAFKNCYRFPFLDNTDLLQLLMKIRKCSNLCDLLENERKRIATAVNWDHASSYDLPIKWKLHNLDKNFYRESDPFLSRNMEWHLSVVCQKGQNTMKITLSHHQKPENGEALSARNVNQTKTSKNMSGKMPGSGEKDKFNDTSSSLRGVGSTEIPRGAIVTVVALAKVHKQERLNHPAIISFISGSSQPVTLREIPHFRALPMKDGNIEVTVWLQIEPIHSVIMNHLIKKFSHICSEQYIRLIPRQQLMMLLRHKHLEVNSEDAVLLSIGNWAKSNQDQYEVGQLLNCIRWDYVTMSGMISTLRTHDHIRKNSAFQAILRKEFGKRYRKEPIKKIPRNSYKETIHSQANRPSFPDELTDALLESSSPSYVDDTGIRMETQMKDDFNALMLKEYSEQLAKKNEEILKLKEEINRTKFKNLTKDNLLDTTKREAIETSFFKDNIDLGSKAFGFEKFYEELVNKVSRDRNDESYQVTYENSAYHSHFMNSRDRQEIMEENASFYKQAERSASLSRSVHQTKNSMSPLSSSRSRDQEYNHSSRGGTKPRSRTIDRNSKATSWYSAAYSPKDALDTSHRSGIDSEYQSTESNVSNSNRGRSQRNRGGVLDVDQCSDIDFKSPTEGNIDVAYSQNSRKNSAVVSSKPQEKGMNIHGRVNIFRGRDGNDRVQSNGINSVSQTQGSKLELSVDMQSDGQNFFSPTSETSGVNSQNMSFSGTKPLSKSFVIEMEGDSPIIGDDQAATVRLAT